MQMIKFIILITIFGCSSYIGILFSNKYKSRVRELKEMKTSLTVFATKIKFTYESIPQIFNEIGNRSNSNVNNIFKAASEKMNKINASDAWRQALENANTFLNKEDIEILKGLGNLLGKVDLNGQVNEIELVNQFLNGQIDKAEEEKRKNEKLYKMLGTTCGLALVIILI